MLYQINSKNDKALEKYCEESMKEFNNFFILNLKKYQIKIFFVKDRKTIDKLLGQKTPTWLVGWINEDNIYVLDKKNYEKESCHKYSKKEYYSLIKHELAHIFIKKLSRCKEFKPDWLWEGLALYLAKQNKQKPKKFKNFLKYYSKNLKNKGVYNESGYVIEFLIKNYGKEKILKLIKSLKEINSKKEFIKKFKEIYHFELNYKNFNKTS